MTYISAGMPDAQRNNLAQNRSRETECQVREQNKASGLLKKTKLF